MKQTYFHSLPLRIWHWINGFIIIMLIVTGFYLRLQGVAALKPHDPFLLWHKRMGFAMIATAIFWFIYNMSKENTRRHYRIRKRHLKGIFPQIEYYLLSIFVGAENPHKASNDDKYNPLQKIAYNSIMFIFLPVQAFTGILFMSFSASLSGNIIGLLGAIHVIFAYLLVLYLIVHLYMATLGDTVFSHTKAMIVGYKKESHEKMEDENNSIPVKISPEKNELP